MIIPWMLALAAALTGPSHQDKGARQRDDRLLQQVRQAPPHALAASWEIPVAGTSIPMLTGMENAFVVTTRAGLILAYRAAGGAPLWQTDLASPVAAPPIFAGGRLAVVAGPPDLLELVLIDPGDGRPVARASLGLVAADPIASRLDAGIAVSGAMAGVPALVLIDPREGAVRWKASLPSPLSVPASQCGQRILIGGADGTLMALSAADGALQWKKRIGGPITTPPLCRGKRAYVGSADNRVHAVGLGRRRCRALWSYLSGSDIAGRMMLFQQRVIFFSYDTYLYSVEADNGHLAWKVRLGRRPQRESLILGSLLVAAQLNTDRLETFRLPEGVQAGALSLPGGKDRFVTPPVRAGSMVVIGAARYGEEASRIIGIDLLGGDKAGSPSGSPPR
jgi:outer membrane protein assembly factor BamB